MVGFFNADPEGVPPGQSQVQLETLLDERSLNLITFSAQPQVVSASKSAKTGANAATFFLIFVDPHSLVTVSSTS